MMRTSTLKKLSFSELYNKHKSLNTRLYLVGTACILSIFVMVYFILNTEAGHAMNFLSGGLAVLLLVYLYNLSDTDTQVNEEMWMRKYQHS